VATVIGFPETVDERAARTVAGGVVALTATALISDRPWLAAPIAYGFAARVLAGPTLSPLGLLATRVVVPRLAGEPRMVPGAPKRLAQGMGLGFSGGALLLGVGLRRPAAARVMLGALLAAASLESFAGICLACKMFPYLVRAGIVSERACPDCADIRVHARHEAA
jgi:hypothetical protein